MKRIFALLLTIFFSCVNNGRLLESTPAVSVYKFSIETDVFTWREIIILREEQSVYELYGKGISSFGSYNTLGDTLILMPSFVLDGKIVYSPETYTREIDLFFINYSRRFLILDNQLIEVTDYNAYAKSPFVSSLPELDCSLIESAVALGQFMPNKEYIKVGEKRRWYNSLGLKEPILEPQLTIYKHCDDLGSFIILRDSKFFELYDADGSECILGYWQSDWDRHSADTIELIPCFTFDVNGKALNVSEIDTSFFANNDLRLTYRITPSKMVEVNNSHNRALKKSILKRVYK